MKPLPETDLPGIRLLRCPMDRPDLGSEAEPQQDALHRGLAVAAGAGHGGGRGVASCSLSGGGGE